MMMKTRVLAKFGPGLIHDGANGYGLTVTATFPSFRGHGNLNTRTNPGEIFQLK